MAASASPIATTAAALCRDLHGDGCHLSYHPQREQAT